MTAPISPAEPHPLVDILCKDTWPPLLRGGPIGWGHEDLDGRNCYRCWGIYTIHELKVCWIKQLIDRNPSSMDFWTSSVPVDLSFLFLHHILLLKPFHLCAFIKLRFNNTWFELQKGSIQRTRALAHTPLHAKQIYVYKPKCAPL